MVNIFDCVGNVASDRYGFLKIFILSIPAIMGTFAVIDGQDITSNIMYVGFSIIYLAVFFETIRRSCTAEQMLLPSFLLPLKMFITLGSTILASVPPLIICFGIFYGFMNFSKNNPQIFENATTTYIFWGILTFISVSIYFSSVTQYLSTGKIVDAYRPIKSLRALKTFIVNLIFYLIQAAFLTCLLYIPALIILFLNGMNSNVFYIIYLCMLSVFEFLVLADYLGQTKKDSENPYERIF